MRVTMNAEFYDRNTAERWNKLEHNGTRVAIYGNNKASEANDWCAVHCAHDYAWSNYSVLIDPDVYNRSIAIADGKIPNPAITRDSNWMEATMSDMLARELQREIDNEILEQLGVKRASAWFWFEDRDDAMLFKLTYGGE